MNTSDNIPSNLGPEEIRSWHLNRRLFLRGLGASLALPAFEALKSPAWAQGQAVPVPGAEVGRSHGTAPTRMAFVYFPNGVHQEHWWPHGSDRAFELSRTLAPLTSVRDKLQVYGGLDHLNAIGGPDGPGDHARAGGTFLTGVRVRKTAGSDIYAGVSVDQVAAQAVGHLTRFPSLELTCDAIRRSGNCDSGYSCAYQYNMSWSSPTLPVAPEANPRLVFERLFGAGRPGERRENFLRRQAQQRSILDFVLEDTRALKKELSARDIHKLDEYLTSVREIEQQIERAEQFPETPDPDQPTPDGIPNSYQEHIRLMFRMLVLAFQTDTTRIATFLLAGDGNNRAFPEIGISEGHHYLSHHQNRKPMMDKIAEIDVWYVQQYAWFLEELNRIEDVDGRSLLDNSMIVYGCGNSDGNRHTHNNLPILLAGGGGGTLHPGRFVQHPSLPACNLFLSLLDRMGVQGMERFGDSTGRLTNV